MQTSPARGTSLWAGTFILWRRVANGLQQRLSASLLPRAARVRVSLATILALCIAFSPSARGQGGGEPVEAEFLPFPTIAPQDIAFDGETYWITALLAGRVYNFSADLKTELKQLVVPGQPLVFPTGIAFDPVGTNGTGSLYVADSFNTVILEMDRDGTVIRQITPRFLPGSLIAEFLYCMSFNPFGNGGQGSLFVVELQGTTIYEFDLNGNVLNSFLHPNDPDGFPGIGLSTTASDVEPTFGNDRVTGFYLTAGQANLRHELLQVGIDGMYEGARIPLQSAGGSVSGVLRRPFPRPSDGQIVDSFILIVDSTAEIAIVPAVEPAIRELVDVQAQTLDRTVLVTWDSFGQYDRIEVYERCELVAIIPGDSTFWQHDFGYDGVFEFTLRAIRGALSTESAPVLTVVGPGAVRDIARLPDLHSPTDIATDGNGLFLVTDRRDRLVALLDENFVQVDTLPISEDFLGDGDWVTGVATDGIRIYLYNLHTFSVAQMDGLGGIERVFELRLPNLEEDPDEPPNRGLVVSMTYDAAGDGGNGSLCLFELFQRTVYEVDLQGRVLRSFPHPYIDVFPPEPGFVDPILATAVGTVPGAPDELFLSGGIAGSPRQTHILRMSKTTGEIITGSQMPLAAFVDETDISTVLFTAFSRDGEPRLAVLPFGDRRRQVLELEAGDARISAPTFLRAQQRTYENIVTLEYFNENNFDAIEIARDCESISTVAGTDTMFVDTTPQPGVRDYRVRGQMNGNVGDDTNVRVRVGQGAVLVQRDTQPSLGGWQLTDDPVSRDYHMITREFGKERTVYTYDRNFNYIRARETNLHPLAQEITGVGKCDTELGYYWDGTQCQLLTACSCIGADCTELFANEADCIAAFDSIDWQLSTLAVRVDPQRNRELVLIAREVVTGLGQGGTEEFLLQKETVEGERISQRSFDPPRPTDGSVTLVAGLTWDPFTDTFYLLARNSDRFLQLTADGDLMRTFPHPRPPFQDFVFNVGLDFVPERGTLFITGSTLFDNEITRILEMDVNGALTGFEIPFEVEGYHLAPIHLRGFDLVTVGTRNGSRSAFFRMKAFEGLPDPFLRGDVSGNGSIDITDVIRILNHLFAGSPNPVCEDAADIDDDGRIVISDAIQLLGHLFNSGVAPSPPHPEPGIDPTPDGLQCFEL